MRTLAIMRERSICFHSRHSFWHHSGCAWVRTITLTSLAMAAFASNSILCRLALGKTTIDPASFTTVRLISGALVLFLLLGGQSVKRGVKVSGPGNWVSAAMLFLYAVAFSFAYVRLQIGTGSLILFGAVQATMIVTALCRGERPVLLEYIGLAAALAGLTYLVFPGLQAPSPVGAVLMASAGAAWGVYTLRGRGAVNPAAVTADNFRRSVPFVLIVSMVLLRDAHISVQGMLLAAISGGLTSALGYVIWYAVLPDLSTTQAALVQLVVPVLAAGGGILFLAESLSMRLVLSAVMILGGIALAITSPKRAAVQPPSPR